MAVFYAILMVFCMASGAAWWQAASPAWAAVSALMAAASGAGLWREHRLRQREQDGSLHLSPPPDLPEDLLPERFDKAVEDYNIIHRALPQVKDGGVRQAFREMQQTGRGILNHLEKHPEKLPRARRFIDYYQEQAKTLLLRYQEMEAAGLSTGAFREATEKLRPGLRDLAAAYRDQLARLFDDDISAMDADLKVMRQMMEADGIRPGAASVEGGSGASKDGGAEAFRPRARAEETPRPGQTDWVYARRAAYDEDRRLARRQKIIAGALAIFLGAFGAHKFYFGKTKWGVLYALLCWTGIPGFVGFVEGLRFLFMPLDDFYEDYYKSGEN